jgi:hypothetical protein
VRLSAWICGFSSIANTAAATGGLRYSPTRSRIFSTRSGSGETLKLSGDTKFPLSQDFLADQPSRTSRALLPLLSATSCHGAPPFRRNVWKTRGPPAFISARHPLSSTYSDHSRTISVKLFPTIRPGDTFSSDWLSVRSRAAPSGGPMSPMTPVATRALVAPSYPARRGTVRGAMYARSSRQRRT